MPKGVESNFVEESCDLRVGQALKLVRFKQRAHNGCESVCLFAGFLIKDAGLAKEILDIMKARSMKARVGFDLPTATQRGPER
jgi:hypothetical protein